MQKIQKIIESLSGWILNRPNGCLLMLKNTILTAMKPFAVPLKSYQAINRQSAFIHPQIFTAARIVDIISIAVICYYVHSSCLRPFGG